MKIIGFWYFFHFWLLSSRGFYFWIFILKVIVLMEIESACVLMLFFVNYFVFLTTLAAMS
jgi:hypothetical protein